MTTEYKFSDGTFKIVPTSLGETTCEEGDELLYDYQREGRGDRLSGGEGNIFTGTQEGWHAKVNRALASRWQHINFNE